MKHKVISKPHEKVKTELVATNTMQKQSYPSLEDTLKADLKQFSAPKRIKRSGSGYIILRILQKFRDDLGRDPMPESRNDDFKKLLQIRDDLGNGIVSDEAFTFVFGQISPAAAIVGGELAQEIIKTVSQKEAPLHNFFIFDPERNCGYIEQVQCTGA